MSLKHTFESVQGKNFEVLQRQFFRRLIIIHGQARSFANSALHARSLDCADCLHLEQDQN